MGMHRPRPVGVGMIECVRALGLSARRGLRTVVDGLDWRFARGRVHWLTGDNGDGKSTLARVLAGRARPSRGRLVVETTAGRLRRRPTSVFYAPAMRIPPDVRVGAWERLTGALTAGRGGAGPGLWPEGPEPGRPVGRSSTGEAKRLLLDALLALPSEVTVLDEPYDHLSGGARRLLTAHLSRRARRSIVVVATNQALPVPVDPATVLVLGRDAAAGAGAGAGRP